MDTVIEDLEKGVPIFYLKFEELRDTPKETLEGLFKFLLNLGNIEETVI